MARPDAGPLPYWRLSGFYLCYFSLLGVSAPYLALYFHSLGFSSARIGELVAIPMLMRCVAPNLWGWLGDYTGRRLAIVRLGAVCTMLAFALILIDKSYGWLAMVMGLYAFFWHAILPQFEVITLAHLKSQTSRYSQIRLWGSIGFILAVVALGSLFERFGMGLFPYVVLAIMAGIALSSGWVPGAQPLAGEPTSGQGGFIAQLGRPGVLAFYLSVALMVLSHGPFYTFLTLYLETLGYSRGVIGVLWAVGVVAEVLVFMVMSRVLQRYTVRQVLIASFALAVARWGLLGAFADRLPVLLLVQVMHAATFGSFHAAAVHFVQRSFGARQQGQGQALYAALSGIGGALGALYSGYSWTALGAGWTFAIASLAALAAVCIMALSGAQTPEQPDRP